MGRETEVGKIWRMIRMNWIKQEYGYLVLFDSETIAVKDNEKAEMLAKTYAKIHSSDDISNEGRKGRGVTIAENEGRVQQEEDTSDLLNKPFPETELKQSLKKTKMSAPGTDQICYIMLNRLSETSEDIFLELCIKCGRVGNYHKAGRRQS